jgi:hypothetical protein
VPSLTGLPALDVLFGLSFLFFLLSLVCSSINEALAVALRLRARTLEEGIRSLLGSDAHADAFYEHWRVQALMRPLTGWHRRMGLPERKPSYIPSRVFGLTMLDTLAPPPAGSETHDLVEQARTAIGTEGMPAPVRGMLRDALNEADGDAVRLRRSIERSFDEVMDRATGWYKRRIQVILFVLALVLAGALNADTLAIGQRLWKDEALRSAVVAQANKGLDSGSAACAKRDASTTAADVAARCIDHVKELGLPLGWSGPPHGWGYPAKGLGLLITAFALTLGAPFWFDLLGKIARLRGSGPPAAGGEEKAERRPAVAPPPPHAAR